MRKYLIAIGSSECSKMGLSSLSQVKNDVEKIVQLFERQGYVRVLADQIDIDEISSIITTTISSWFANFVFQPNDHIVIYYAGHGDQGGLFGDHYLFTFDSKKDNTKTAIKTKDLVESFFGGDASRLPSNILLILDVCYAGSGARQVGGILQNLKGELSSGSGISIVSSANSTTEAGDGAFVEALTTVMEQSETYFEKESKFISIGTLVDRINQYFEKTCQAQRAVKSDAEVYSEDSFISNPHYFYKEFPNHYRLLPIVNQIELPRLRSAYIQSFPESDLNPTTIEQIFSDLLSLPKGKIELFPSFIRVLSGDQSLSDEIRGTLQEWMKENQINTSETQIPKSIVENHLMIYVSKNKQCRDKYSIKVGFLKDFDPNGKDTLDYLVNELEVDFSGQDTFDRDEVWTMIEGLVQENIDPYIPHNKMKIQFFLPKELLSLKVDLLEIEIGPTRQPIGSLYEVVVRSSQRQGTEGNWIERWDSCDRSNSCQDGLITSGTEVSQFRVDLKDSNYAGCILQCVEQDGIHLKMIDAMLLAGLPIAIWSRDGESTEGLPFFSNRYVQELPQMLFEQRFQYFGSEIIYPQIVLMWDNPYRPFPGSDDSLIRRSA